MIMQRCSNNVSINIIVRHCCFWNIIRKRGIVYSFEGETSDVIYPKIKLFLEQQFAL
jgi:hypothetical protein